MKKKLIGLLIATSMVASMLAGCGDETNSEATASEEVVAVEENEHLAVNTVIAYSAGSDSDWSYGNQRKEFPDEEKCYVRIASTLTTDKGKYENSEVIVTYRFTGTNTCDVNVSDGLVQKVETGDPNVTEYTHSTYANKEKNAAEDIVIFQYIPKGSDGITLEVIYDDQVAARYDARNAIYFNSNGETTVQEVTVEENGEELSEEVIEENNSQQKKENGTN